MTVQFLAALKPCAADADLWPTRPRRPYLVKSCMFEQLQFCRFAYTEVRNSSRVSKNRMLKPMNDTRQSSMEQTCQLACMGMLSRFQQLVAIVSFAATENSATADADLENI